MTVQEALLGPYSANYNISGKRSSIGYITHGWQTLASYTNIGDTHDIFTVKVKHKNVKVTVQMHFAYPYKISDLVCFPEL